MEDVLSFRNEAFYNLIEQKCGGIAVEIMKAQDISSVECLLDVDNVFTFLELDSDELIPLKRKAGILLNDGRFVVKKGIIHKVEMFLSNLRAADQQYSTYSIHQKSNKTSDLVVPEALLQKFPFIRTLIVYSNIIEKSQDDFKLLNIILNNMIRNLITQANGYRYDQIVRQFATSLYILGGRTAYDFVRLNIPGFLPSIQIIQSFIAASANNLIEGQFNYDGLHDYFNTNQSRLGFYAEDLTAIIPKITYDAKSNTFIGFSLPLDNNGIPITNSFSTNSFNQLEKWCSDVPIAKSLNACLVQPLSSSCNNKSPYLLAAFSTDNTFKATNIISRWQHVFEECKTKGIRIIGYSTDCDSRYLNAMKISLGFFGSFAYDGHPDLFNIDIPRTWSWFYMHHNLLYICFQDAIHICTKLRNRLLSQETHLLLGNQLINMEPLLFLINNYSKLDHLLVHSDLNPKDRQNYRSAEKISSNHVLNLLDEIPNSCGISIYLQAIKSIRLAYIEKETSLIDRIFHAWTSVFIFRLWYMWINEMEKKQLDSLLSKLSDIETIADKKQSKTKRKYFITYQSHFSVEINAHCLIYLAMLVAEGELPTEALQIWLQNSQTCEGLFRSARAISSLSSSGVNFTASQFLSRANKLAVLQHIKSNTNMNNLRFPRHHKLSIASSNIANTLNSAALSKELIETVVLNAYKFATDLFGPLKIKQLLRNGRVISIEQLSNAIAQRLDMFWTTDSNPDDSDEEEDDDNPLNNFENYYDSDEEEELNDGIDTIDNVTSSTNSGIRLFDNVKYEMADKFFKVNINHQHKHLHKQAACWLVEKNKNSLSADRLSRCRGQ